MKINIEKANDRGKSDLGWLQSRFSYRFADYYNPKRSGFGDLRVVNDDIISPSKGFGLHQHENMEIITIVTKGTLSHKDNTGSQGILTPDEVQVMSAGSGVMHSEYNHSKSEKVELFQIWIQTAKKNAATRYDQKKFDLKKNEIMLVVSGKEDMKSLFIYQDAKILLLKIDKNKKMYYTLPSKKGLFVMMIEGTSEIADKKLERRDAIEISQTKEINIKGLEDSYLLLIEVNV